MSLSYYRHFLFFMVRGGERIRTRCEGRANYFRHIAKGGGGNILDLEFFKFFGKIKGHL